MSAERDPKRIPIHLAFGLHSAEHISSIDSLRGIAKAHLDSSGEGKVAWFNEDTNVNAEKAQAVRRARDEGAGEQLYVFAYSNFVFPEELKTKEAKKSMTQTYIERTRDGFMRYEFETQDALSTEYPGRVCIVFEEAPKVALVQEKTEDNNAQNLGAKSNDLVDQGHFLEALPYFQEEKRIEAENFLRKRDSRIADVLKTEVEYPDTLAVVGHIGAEHTGVYFNLKREGYAVDRFFPQKEKIQYLYSPNAAAERSLAFFPEKTYTEERWLKILVQNAVWGILIVRKESAKLAVLINTNDSIIGKVAATLYAIRLRWLIPKVPQSEQAIIKLTYAATADFDKDKIQIFENSVRKEGLIKPIARLIAPYI